ncbi:conserved hypothetical protein [Talaromyces stipitatus ATCC 10500]|uniref:Major facilitator superfamily (MFS) profile domain-containing protein n=1 Tax=Talaromyces stipitatus (strain ATCC 10500 / CBS 375.48 / QM 6759 / NRRL 1006) TaxID=441959 RepID=B8MFT0_TALSN|nr:uncharacterized protein TSTA_009210 [Talaromyces stipitatus ATCC 10500]EED15797.1 conserved hypothetical protein [Talaromyces stipitatus ATCC 10500]
MPSEKTLTETVPVTDWDSDSRNPHNWPTWKRAYHSVLPAVFGLVVTVGSSIYTSAVDDVKKAFHISDVAATVPFSLFLLGLGFGPMLAAPLSENFGRTSSYVISLPIYALFTLGAGFSHTFGALVACRFLAGIFASPPLVVGAGTIADIWKPEHRALTTTLFALCPFLGPALGPVMGGFAVAAKGWRWTQWIILFWAVFAYLLVLGMHETYKKIIVARASKKAGGHFTPPGPSGREAIILLFQVTLIRPIKMLYSEPIVIAWSLYIGFTFAVLYSFFAAFPYVYATVYGFDIQQIGLTFIPVAIGTVLGSITFIWIDQTIYQKRNAQWTAQGGTGRLPPEQRLYASMIGGCGLPIGLFWFAWTARPDIHWISPMIATVVIGWGNMCITVRFSSILPCIKSSQKEKEKEKGVELTRQ